MKGAILDWIRSVADRITSSSILQYETRYELGDLQPDSLVTKYLLLNNSLIPVQITRNVTGGTTPNGMVIAHTGMTFPGVAFYTPSGDEYTGANFNDDGTNITVTGDDDGSGHFVDTFLIVISGTTSGGAPAPGMTQLTGDVTGGPGAGSQAVTVVQINGRTKSYYDVTSSIQTQLDGKQPSLGFTPYSDTNPADYITHSDVIQFNTAKPGKTGAVSGEVTYTEPGISDVTIRLGAWVRILTVTGGFTIKVSAVFTDENGDPQTQYYYQQGSTSPNLSTAVFFAFSPIDIRMKQGSTAGLAIPVVTGTGTIIYDYGGTIQILG